MKWSHHDGIAVLTLDDPDRRNALTRPMAQWLIDSVDRAERDERIGAIVITGAGTAFCAGADLADLIAATRGDTSGLDLVYESFGRVAESPLPTVAAVNGAAVGAGLNLALACDVRIAAEHARFESRFIEIGIHPGGGHTWMLERAVGPQVAAAMVLFGTGLSGQEAVSHGLALRTCPDHDILANALELARQAAAGPSELLASVKSTLRTAHSLPTRLDAVAIETERQRMSLGEPAAVQRLSRLQARISGRSARKA